MSLTLPSLTYLLRTFWHFVLNPIYIRHRNAMEISSELKQILVYAHQQFWFGLPLK